MAAWDDLETFIADLVRDLLLGRDVTLLAGRLGKSDDLLYKWANPNCEQLPSLKQILVLMKLTDDFRPLQKMAAAAGLVAASRQGSAADILRRLAEELENGN